MARVALIKIFTGLNMGISQLAAELFHAGHHAHMFHFKEYLMKPREEIGDLQGGEPITTTNGRDMSWMLYRRFTETEYQILINELKEYKPDIIGFNVTAAIAEPNIELTRRLREHFTVPMLWGGTAPTLEPELSIKHADIICINEGEEVIVELANLIDKGADISGIQGTWYKTKSGEIIKNPKRPLLDLNKIQRPLWDKTYNTFIDDNKLKLNYFPRMMKKEYPIMTQRGCPFSCSFCIESRYQELFGKKDSLRRRDPHLVIEELQWAKSALPIKKILFYDDVFTVNPRWLDEFLPMYKREIDLPFWCYTYPTTHNPQILKLLKDHGCVSVGMGVQTGSERLLKGAYNRPTKLDRLIESAKEIVDAGLEGTFDLITRGPFDTEDDLRSTFNLLLDFPKELHCLGFGRMALMPTFSLSRQAEEAGLLCKDTNTYETPLPDSMYDYYHKLYLLTRTSLEKDDLVKIAEDPKYRNDLSLLDELVVHYAYNKDKKSTFFGRDWIT